MKNLFIEIGDFFTHLIRRILFFLTNMVISLICGIIYLVTYEPNTKKKVTVRKIRRIRRLTNIKLWIWRNFGWYFRFIHNSKYLETLEVKFGNKVNIN